VGHQCQKKLGALGWLSWPRKTIEARMSRMQLPRAVDGEEVSLALLEGLDARGP